MRKANALTKPSVRFSFDAVAASLLAGELRKAYDEFCNMRPTQFKGTF